MNSKTLVNALKVAVREVIKEELTEILREGLQSAAQIMEDPETGKNMSVDPLIADVMNRDYRGLMKAIDKKKGK